MKLGVSRNDPCPCGSGSKYKKYCLDRDDAASRQLTSADVDVLRPGALCLMGESHVPAIVCGEPNIPRYVSQLQQLPTLDCEQPDANAQVLTEEEAP